MDESDLNIGS